MSFKVIGNRGAHLVTTQLTFVTCWINGMNGTMTTAPQIRGMMRNQKHFNRVLAYAKQHLPSAHALAEKGWNSLPNGVHTLPSHVAMPADSSDDHD